MLDTESLLGIAPLGDCAPLKEVWALLDPPLAGGRGADAFDTRAESSRAATRERTWDSRVRIVSTSSGLAYDISFSVLSSLCISFRICNLGFWVLDTTGFGSCFPLPGIQPMICSMCLRIWGFDLNFGRLGSKAITPSVQQGMHAVQNFEDQDLYPPRRINPPVLEHQGRGRSRGNMTEVETT